MRRLLRETDLVDQLTRHRGRHGARALRTLLARAAGPAFTRSEAERRLLALVRAARLPEPETNVRIGSYEVDFLWRDQQVIVEVDGYAAHAHPAAFERDRDRTNDLQLQGFTVLRVTWRQLVERPTAVIARVRRALR